MSNGANFSPDPEEAVRIVSHFGPAGPVACVWRWLDMIRAGNFASAWAGMDDNLRLCRAQASLWANRTVSEIAALDLEEEAERLAAVPSTSALWSDFATTELHQLHETWHHRFQALAEGRLGAGSGTRVLGPDLELVLLLEGDGEVQVFNEPILVPDAFPFAVRLTGDGWKVAAYGDFIPEPGWPPTFVGTDGFHHSMNNTGRKRPVEPVDVLEGAVNAPVPQSDNLG